MIYAPLHQAPVVEVRVFYHVGSRDERPDRQGFAHMFEHMMFRGSAHVAAQAHMKILGAVGAQVNAFTSFDQTVYHETLPSSSLETALYLEADRMAGFRVSDTIFGTERKVVAEEWRMRYMNQPYGRLFQDFLGAAFTTHSYRWTPIGNMDQLKASRSNELQDFFNTYYLPNNAVLVLAGDIEVDAAKALVAKYFGWIPKGPAVPRDIPVEPEQTEARHVEVSYRAPLPRIQIGYHVPGYKNEDHQALDMLGLILGDGRSSRLQKMLVSSEHPLAVQASASDMRLEDAGVFMIGAIVMQGKDPLAVEKDLKDAVADVVAHGVTQEELDKAKTQERIALVQARETATDLAEQVGEEALMTGDPNRVNTDPARMEAVTLADIRSRREGIFGSVAFDDIAGEARSARQGRAVGDDAGVDRSDRCSAEQAGDAARHHISQGLARTGADAHRFRQGAFCKGQGDDDRQSAGDCNARSPLAIGQLEPHDPARIV